MKPFLNIPLMFVIWDVFLNTVSSKTVAFASLVPPGDYEFVNILAGAPSDVDFAELGALAREELIRYLEGNHGNPGN